MSLTQTCDERTCSLHACARRSMQGGMRHSHTASSSFLRHWGNNALGTAHAFAMEYKVLTSAAITQCQTKCGICLDTSSTNFPLHRQVPLMASATMYQALASSLTRTKRCMTPSKRTRAGYTGMLACIPIRLAPRAAGACLDTLMICKLPKLSACPTTLPRSDDR